MRRKTRDECKRGEEKKMTAAKGNTRKGKGKQGSYRRNQESFHLKLKHVLGGVSLLSLLAAFEVFSIPAGSGIIDLLGLTRISAAKVWFGIAIFAAFVALILHKEEEAKL